jgi:Fur family zinc uptake transcriptional regulator
MTAYAILARLRRFGVAAPTTVYRALNLLEKKGLVHRIESLNAFLACRHARAHAPAPFAVCLNCGKVAEIGDPKLAAALARKSRLFLGEVRKNVLEIAGLCRTCAKNVKKERPSCSR